MKAENTTKIQFDSLSINEAYARSVVAAFLAVRPHGAPAGRPQDRRVRGGDQLHRARLPGPHRPGDPLRGGLSGAGGAHHGHGQGVGIPDVPQAMEPLFTTGNPEERSGLGFAVMQSFMDRVKVTSRPGKGTKVVLIKRLSARAST